MADISAVKLEDMNNTLTSHSTVETTWIMLCTPVLEGEGGEEGIRILNKEGLIRNR